MSVPFWLTYTFTACDRLFVKCSDVSVVFDGAVRTSAWRGPHATRVTSSAAVNARIALSSAVHRYYVLLRACAAHFGSTMANSTLQGVCASLVLIGGAAQPPAPFAVGAPAPVAPRPPRPRRRAPRAPARARR